jgi:diketogulonate reductase-like aldo/keto reductase
METWKSKEGFELPRLGLGTWGFGGKREADYSDDEDAVQCIKDAVKMGYSHIDTAELYGAGHTEELVGAAIREFKRNDLIIATKVMDSNLKPDNLLRSAERSLKRLGVNYIDLYYIHYPDPVILRETIGAMDRLVDEGLVRNIAASNFTLDLLIEAQSYARHKITVVQIEFSLLTRNSGRYMNNKDMESKTIPYCQENGILVVAERPLERGILLEPNDTMDEMVKKYGKTRAQIAINWITSQKNIVTIPMSHDKEHLRENLGAIDWCLEKTDAEKLGAYYS